jgi:hypothetical protein
VPVLESHIRRHRKPPWPEHDQDCDFYRDRLEQRAIARSFARKRGGPPVSLIGRLAETEAEAVPRVTSRSYAQARGALDCLLVEHRVEIGIAAR